MPSVKSNNSNRDEIILTVLSELKVLGVKVPKHKKFNQKLEISKLEKSEHDTRCKIFGVPLNDQEWVSDDEFHLPKFLALSTAYLRKYSSKEIGLFRKAGNVARQKKLRVILELEGNLEDCEPNDIASLLKQWLRELPEPLIPQFVQDLLIRCLQLECEENRITACLLTCLLLLPDYLHTLKHLLHFLHDIALDSAKNKMDVYNLAVIMAPNVFSMQDSSEKSKNNLVKQHTTLMKTLIENYNKIGEIPTGISFDKCYASSELDSSSEILDSTSNKLKKKCKGGPVQDIFSGFKKLVGQNGTPNAKINTPDCNLKTSRVRSLSKRKAGFEIQSLSAINKKQARSLDALDNASISVTPKQKGMPPNNNASGHVRRKSIGALLRRKDRKRFKSCKLPQEVSQLEQKFPINTEKERLKNQSLELYDDKPVSSVETNLQSQIFKKSVSDGQLPSNKSDLSAQGCLPINQQRTSRRNLRSESLRKLHVGEATILDLGLERNEKGKKASNHVRVTKLAKDLSKAITSEKNLLSEMAPQNEVKHCGNEAETNSENILILRRSPRLSSNSSKNAEGSCNMTMQSLGMKRQEAFIAKSNSNKRKNSDDFTPKLRDRTSVGSKSARIRHHKNSTPDQKGMKRRTRHGSLMRGRPNSVNNGLQSLHPHRLYNNPNVKLNSPCPDLTSQEELLRYHETKIAESPVLQGLDLSLTTLFQNFTLFSPNNFAQKTAKKSVNSESLKQSVMSEKAEVDLTDKNVNNDGKNFLFTPPEITEKQDISLITKNIVDVTTPLLKKRKRLSSKSDSKTHPIKRRSNPKRGKSFSSKRIDQNQEIVKGESISEVELKGERLERESTLNLSSTSFNIEALKSPLNLSEKNLNVSYGNQRMDDSCFKTPVSKPISPESEIWMSGSTFLGILSPPHEEVFNKRESIAMILKNKTGHVQAKVDMYDNVNHGSSKKKERRDVNLLRTPQTCSASKKKIYRNLGSDTRGSSAKNRIKFQKSPLPPPPKFTLTDLNTPSPKALQPLKEVTNTTPRLDEFKTSPKKLKKSISPIQAKSPPKKETLRSELKMKKSKRNSFSGTPYKLSKRVSRSESSPACHRRVIVVNE